MSNRSIRTNQLTPGTKFLVNGKLMFARVGTQYEGESLARANARRQQRRMNPIDKPYTEIAICDAKILYRDPNNKSIEEQYAEECLYRSSSPNYTGYAFSAINKSYRLPFVGTPDGKGGVDVIDMAGRELAAGLNVTVVMSVYKASPNNGVGFDGVIVNEPIRFYAGTIGAGLEAFGLTLNLPDNAMDFLTPHRGEQGAAGAEDAAAAAPGAPLPSYGPAAPNQGAAVPPPQGNPYASNNAPTMPFDRPAAQPGYPAAGAAPAPGYTGQMPGAYPTGGYPGQPAGPEPGVRFDPNADRQY